MAAVIATAIVAQLSLSVGRAIENGNDVPTVIANFFSFFTILLERYVGRHPRVGGALVLHARHPRQVGAARSRYRSGLPSPPT